MLTVDPDTDPDSDPEWFFNRNVLRTAALTDGHSGARW